MVYSDSASWGIAFDSVTLKPVALSVGIVLNSSELLPSGFLAWRTLWSGSSRLSSAICSLFSLIAITSSLVKTVYFSSKAIFSCLFSPGY